MMGSTRFTILGCGSSGGVPRLGGNWGACNPDNPRNRRRRCSLLIEQTRDAGTTRVLVDTSPDMRAQLLDAGVGTLDGVVFTHAHADHVHGIDDLRMIVFNLGRRLPVWADAPTSEALLTRFGYAFVQPEGSSYPPILDMRPINGEIVVAGAGGPVRLHPFEVVHGRMRALGLRIGDLAYLPDVSDIPDSALPLLEGLDCWILDALREKPHPTHFSLNEALSWIDRMAPRRAILTNMHIDLDYDRVNAETPDNVEAAYDGLQVIYRDDDG